jgi:hypothetical protein
MELSKRLEKHLKATQGHLGRAGAEVARLAKLANVSVAMLQSVAMGRRNFRDGGRPEKRVIFWLTRLEAEQAERLK